MSWLAMIPLGLVVGYLSGRAGVGRFVMIALGLVAMVGPLLFGAPGLFYRPSANEAGRLFDRMLLELPKGSFRIVGADTVFVYHRTMNGTGIHEGDNIAVQLTTWDAK